MDSVLSIFGQKAKEIGSGRQEDGTNHIGGRVKEKGARECAGYRV